MTLTATLAMLMALPGPIVQETAPPPSVGLSAERLYCRSGAPVPITIDADPEAGPLTLVLLSHDGGLLGRADDVSPGPMDLAAAMPLEELRRAGWLQLLVNGRAEGTPLVVQPLIGRPPLRTVSDLRSDGTTPYTRVVGWGDELIDPLNEADQALRESWTEGEPTPWSGVRVYDDRDAVLETIAGDIRVALRPDEAPNTAWNFRHLIEGGFYDGTTFHRVVPTDRAGRPFVIQGGDPTGSGDGGPGYDLPIEPSRLPHEFGVISMARADDPDSAGSQFFLCLSRDGTARLDGQYCAFGETVDGSETILAIANVPIADPALGRPESPPRIHRIRLVAAPPRAPGLGRPDRPVEPPLARDPRPDPDGRMPR